MLVGLGDFISAVTSQTGNLTQDPCTAGGAFCPQPENFGASFNPCCWSTAASSVPALDASGNVETASVLGVPSSIASIIPGWLFVVGGGVLLMYFLKDRKGGE